MELSVPFVITSLVALSSIQALTRVLRTCRPIKYFVSIIVIAYNELIYMSVMTFYIALVMFCATLFCSDNHEWSFLTLECKTLSYFRHLVSGSVCLFRKDLDLSCILTYIPASC